MSDQDYEGHTAELCPTRAKAEEAAEHLSHAGWDVYPEKVPLAGQQGFYCVNTVQGTDGDYYRRAHSVRWNIYEEELRPVEIPCQQETDVMCFIWRHAKHEGFDHFAYDDGDVDFICYCQGGRGQSLYLRIDADLISTFSKNTADALIAFDEQATHEIP